MASPYSNRVIKFRNKASSQVCVGANLVNPAGERLLTGCEYALHAGEVRLLSQENFYEACRIHNTKVVAYNGEDRQDTASWVEISRGTLQKHSVVEIAEDDDGRLKIGKKGRL